MLAVIGFGVMVPIAGLLADRFGRRKTMITITLMIIAFVPVPGDARFPDRRRW